MAYAHAKLDVYRQQLGLSSLETNRGPLHLDAIPSYTCASCPYCNGSRSDQVKHIRSETKPNDPWAFWNRIIVAKYRATQSLPAQRNLEGCASPRAAECLPPNKMFAVGPMVDQSELPFRLLCREYGATLTYTPMLHAKSFAESPTYRQQFLTTTPVDEVLQALRENKKEGERESLVNVDRPLIVQFCASDPDTLLQAARYAVWGSTSPPPSDTPLYACDAVDLNLGCPQGIARRGHYGSFLMEEWDLIHTLLHTLHCELEVPVTAKIRVFDRPDGTLDEPLTLAYIKMIRDAGASALCIHGRTRAQKGSQSGLADLAFLQRLCEAIGQSIPVLSNGNVLWGEDVRQHLRAIGSEGHVCAEPLLWDPRLFTFVRPSTAITSRVPSGRLDVIASKEARLGALSTALRYLTYVQHYPVPLGFAKAHLFKICYHSYECEPAWREALSALPVSASPTKGADDDSAFADQLRGLFQHVQGLLAIEMQSTRLIETKKAKQNESGVSQQGGRGNWNFFDSSEQEGEEANSFGFLLAE